MNKLLRSVRALLATLLLAGAAPAFAQPDCPPGPDLEAARLKGPARDRGMLWRLDKDGRTSWLYGTIHVARPEWVVPGPAVMQAIAGSDVVALELDLADPAVLATLQQPADPRATARVLDDPRRQRIARQAARNCLPAGALAAMRPFMQMMGLVISEARREGLYAELAVDLVLTGVARGAGKPVVALETAQQQLAMLMPAEEDERALVDRSLDDLETGHGRRQLARMARMWADGSESELASFPQWCECMKTPAERRLYRRMNDERNPAMADKLAALHAGGQRFFGAVGLLHMSGAHALPELMRQRGFAVQRVRFAP
jgi:uncharacterized protein